MCAAKYETTHYRSKAELNSILSQAEKDLEVSDTQQRAMCLDHGEDVRAETPSQHLLNGAISSTPKAQANTCDADDKSMCKIRVCC